MTRTEMIAALDEEIRRLEAVRTLLRNSRGDAQHVRREIGCQNGAARSHSSCCE